jgi:Flp pilus assembly protein TadD
MVCSSFSRKTGQRPQASFEKSSQLNVNMAMALRAKGDEEGALRRLKMVVATQPANAEAHYYIGAILRQQGDVKGAAEAVETALRIKPDMQEGYYSLSSILKQLAGARPPEGTAVRVRASAEAEYTEAVELLANGDLGGARDKLGLALQDQPDYSRTHNLLGFVLGQTGDLEGALGHLIEAVQLDPHFAEAHFNLGAALWLQPRPRIGD